VKTGEGGKVDGKFAQIRVQLTRESEAACDTAHSVGNKVVKVTEGGGVDLESAEADIIQGLVIQYHDLIGVLNKLMNGQCGVVGLDDGIGHFRGREDREGAHDALGVLLTELGDEQSSHTRTGTTTKRVSNLETL